MTSCVDCKLQTSCAKCPMHVRNKKRNKKKYGKPQQPNPRRTSLGNKPAPAPTKRGPNIRIENTAPTGPSKPKIRWT